GRPVKSGLYRMAVGDDRWELLTRGLPKAPTIRAIATHPEHSETVYVGTQNGPYRSTDNGEHWERLNISDHGLPVWSLLFDPRDSKMLYAGYENCEIFRSEDGGEHWQQLPVTVRFPEVTVAPGANPAKRVLEMAVNPSNPDEVYGAIEVGVLIRSNDGGASWARVDMGVKPRTTMFTIAFDERQPTRMYCATSGGEVFASDDGGQSWAERHLPEGATGLRHGMCLRRCAPLT